MSSNPLGKWMTMDNDQLVIETMFELKQLHGELASLYRTKSSDTKRVIILWREIEKREALLELEGVEYK
jgi:hypothetical protein